MQFFNHEARLKPAMRAGVLVVGKNAGSVGSDMRALPRAILTFVISPFRWLRPYDVGQPHRLHDGSQPSLSSAA